MYPTLMCTNKYYLSIVRDLQSSYFMIIVLIPLVDEPFYVGDKIIPPNASNDKKQILKYL